MIGPFDKLFDFDHDGKLGAFERSMQMEFLDEISKEHDESSNSSGRAGWGRSSVFDDDFESEDNSFED